MSHRLKISLKCRVLNCIELDQNRHYGIQNAVAAVPQHGRKGFLSVRAAKEKEKESVLSFCPLAPFKFESFLVAKGCQCGDIDRVVT